MHMPSPSVTKSRTEVLDIIRGVAILLIFFLNIPAMGATAFSHFNPSLIPWDTKNQATWWFLNVFVQGTQRGLLEILFGAGVLMLLDRTMQPDGPVEAADLFFRRNLWLAAFGLFDIFIIGWFGDILLEYAIAALLVFPFRRLAPRTLLLVSFTYLAVISGATLLHDRHEHMEQKHVSALLSRQAHGQLLDAPDRQMLADRASAFDPLHPSPQVLAAERARHFASPSRLRGWAVNLYLTQIFPFNVLQSVREAFFSILFGMALFKLGITQGRRSTRYYSWLTILTYGPGLLLRGSSATHLVLLGSATIMESTLGEAARLAVTIGHVAFINLLLRSAGGRALTVFKPAGRMALTLYIMQNLVGMWLLFPGFAFGLYGRFSWFGFSMIGLATVLAQLFFAHLWMRVFAIGPLEWIWRSLTAGKRQPFFSRSAGTFGVLP